VLYTQTYDLLTVPFRLPAGPTIPTGGYDFQNVRASYTFGAQRKLAGTISSSHGTYYDGMQTAFGVSGGRVQLTPRFSLEPSVAINWFNFSYGELTTKVVRSRVNYTFTPRMFVSGLVQYNSGANSVSTNLRWRWEYNPGSELFVVYTDDNRAELVPGQVSRLLNRGLVVKINRLVRF
jgi:hypothetical protein